MSETALDEYRNLRADLDSVIASLAKGDSEIALEKLLSLRETFNHKLAVMGD